MARFESPFIFKIRFYKPEGKNPSKNAAHIKYIGTRPGVSIDDEQVLKNDNELILDQENGEKAAELKNFLNKDHDFWEINHNEESKGISPDTAAGHIKYAEERPGSHGLFDQSGENVSLRDLQSELNTHDGIVWRAILSLKESDAAKLGYLEKEKWEDMLRATVANAASQIKIKESNLRWVAAYHAEEGHPHVHLVLWEKNPTRTKGILSKGEREDMKRVFMREVYAEDRIRLHQEKTANRDLMRDLAKGEIQSYVKILKDVKSQDLDVALEQKAIGNLDVGLAPRMFRQDEKLVMAGLRELAEIMPTKGRMAFQYMPDAVKGKSLAIADSILSNAFSESMNGYMKAVEEQTLLHTLDPGKIEQAKQNAYEDIRKRIANLVIRGAGELNRRSYLTLDESVKDEAIHAFKNASGSQETPEQAEKAVKGFAKVLLAAGVDENEVKQNIADWKQRSNAPIDDEKLQKAVDSIIKAFHENQKWDRPTILTKKQFKELTNALNIQSPYLWKSTFSQDNTLNIARNVWKSVFNAIEQERIQGKAQAELQRKQIERQRQKQQEQGRER